MDGFGVSSALFCEQCGLDRDQLGDESIAPFRECPSCARAVCPNCWNLVRASCLRCAPFSLATAAAPTVVPLTPAAPPSTAAARRRDGPGGQADARARSSLAGARRPRPQARSAAAGRHERRRPPTAARSATSRGRSVPAATVVDTPWPATGSAAEPIRTPVRPARVTTRRRGRPVRLRHASPGWSWCSWPCSASPGSRWPRSVGCRPPAAPASRRLATQTPTQPDGSSRRIRRRPSPSRPARRRPIPADHGGHRTRPDTTGPTGDTGRPRDAPGAHGAPGATVRPDGSTPKPTATAGATATATATATPRPRAEPTPTPTPDPDADTDARPHAGPDAGPDRRRRPRHRRRPHDPTRRPDP